MHAYNTRRYPNPDLQNCLHHHLSFHTASLLFSLSLITQSTLLVQQCVCVCIIFFFYLVALTLYLFESGNKSMLFSCPLCSPFSSHITISYLNMVTKVDPLFSPPSNIVLRKSCHAQEFEQRERERIIADILFLIIIIADQIII